MGTIRVLYNIIKAGFLERSRRYSFFITLGFIVFIAYKYIPPINADYLTLSLGNIRGVYNSAWVGAALAMISSTILSIPAFYLVKNSVERDRQTGVGQIIAATPMKRLMYTMGKMFSNFTLLAAMVFAIAFSALIMQLVRGEDFALNIPALLAPFIYSTLPTMAIVAALAIMFETITFLRGGFGNIAYFFLWVGYNTMELIMNTKGSLKAGNDLLGINPIISSMINSASAAFPDYHSQFVIGMTSVFNGVKTFEWQGVQWTANMVAGRLLWVLAALFLASASALFFDRFDTARIMKSKKSDKTGASGAGKSVMLTVLNRVKISGIYEKLNIKSGFVRILSGELMLMLKGLSGWCYLVLLVLNLAALVCPIDTVQQMVLPLTLIMPLLVWSSMGVREKYSRTQQLVFISPGLMKHQFYAMLLSGIITATLSAGGVVIRFAAEGMWINVAALAAAALFISALALLCGVWSGSSKVFEVLYMVIWYIGPLNKMEYLDFMGATRASTGIHMYGYYFIAALLLAGMALLGRIHQTKQIN